MASGWISYRQVGLERSESPTTAPNAGAFGSRIPPAPTFFLAIRSAKVGSKLRLLFSYNTHIEGFRLAFQ